MNDLLHFRREYDRLCVVPGDRGHAGGGFVNFAAVVDAAAGQNDCDLLAENVEKMNWKLSWNLLYFLI